MKRSTFFRYLLAMLLVLPVLVQAKRMTYKKVAPIIKQQLCRYGYTGQEREQELKEGEGIYNYRAREYNPQLRRFLSPDKGKQQHATYAYVGNNPVSCVDPDGKRFRIFVKNGDLTIVDFNKLLNLYPQAKAIYMDGVDMWATILQRNGSDRNSSNSKLKKIRDELFSIYQKDKKYTMEFLPLSGQKS